MIFALIFVLNVLPFFNNTQTPLVVKIVFLGFIGLFFVLIPALTVLNKYVSSHGFSMVVTVNKAGIVMRQKRQSKTISRESISSLDYATIESTFSRITTSGNGQSYANNYTPAWIERLRRFARSKGVIVKSREGVFYIGAGLPDAELVYLYSLISGYFTTE
jgi:hypothetical protein